MLQQFYAGSLGGVTRRIIGERLRAIWPARRACETLGIGYATPYLRPFLNDGACVTAVMPLTQGATRWPAEGLNVCALADEERLPFADESIDRLLLAHALEGAPRPVHMLRECWRVLRGEGRLAVIAPHRRSAWAGLDRTPFGHGRAFSPSQLDRLLRESLFEPLNEARALWVPPMENRMALASAPAIERIGRRWLSGLCGVLIVEAKKTVYGLPNAKAEKARRLVFSPLPAYGRRSPQAGAARP